MATVSFTFGGNYDANNIVRMAQNGLDSYSGPFDQHAFGTINSGIFYINDTGNPDGFGTFFIDADRFDEMMPGMNIPKRINGNEYSVNIDLSDNIQSVNISGGDFGDILRGGSGNDILTGGGGNDVLEGGLGSNSTDGGLGLNTLTYENYVSLDNRGIYAKFDVGIAQSYALDLQDSFSNINNLTGSSYDDAILGSSESNVLIGGAGNDELYGRAGDDTLRGGTGTDSLRGEAGNDRLVIEETPGFVSGGGDKDFLFVAGGGSVSLTESTFEEIEAVYVRNDTHLDMSAVDTGTRITSQSTAGHGVEIIGTAGNDAITGGKGADTLDGGLGNDRIQAGGGGAQIDGREGGDKLFAGAGADTFHFQAGFGRDNVYGFDVETDHIGISIAGIDGNGVTLRSFNDGQDTLVTFVGVETGNKIILHDVTVAQVEGHNGLFTFAD